jgi:hypothetical protein
MVSKFMGMSPPDVSSKTDVDSFFPSSAVPTVTYPINSFRMSPITEQMNTAVRSRTDLVSSLKSSMQSLQGSAKTRSESVSALGAIIKVCSLSSSHRVVPRSSNFPYVGMKMADPVPQFSHILSNLASSHPRLSYVHFIDARINPDFPEHETLDFARAIWTPTGRPFLIAGGFTPELALEHFKQPGRENDVVVFGRWFIANVSNVFSFSLERNRVTDSFILFSPTL